MLQRKLHYLTGIHALREKTSNALGAPEILLPILFWGTISVVPRKDYRKLYFRQYLTRYLPKDSSGSFTVVRIKKDSSFHAIFLNHNKK